MVAAYLTPVLRTCTRASSYGTFLPLKKSRRGRSAMVVSSSFKRTRPRADLLGNERKRTPSATRCLPRSGPPAGAHGALFLKVVALRTGGLASGVVAPAANNAM